MTRRRRVAWVVVATIWLVVGLGAAAVWWNWPSRVRVLYDRLEIGTPEAEVMALLAELPEREYEPMGVDFIDWEGWIPGQEEPDRVRVRRHGICDLLPPSSLLFSTRAGITTERVGEREALYRDRHTGRVVGTERYWYIGDSGLHVLFDEQGRLAEKQYFQMAPVRRHWWVRVRQAIAKHGPF